MFKRKRPQEAFFASLSWGDKGCFLRQMTGDRCDYIESCIDGVFGRGALAQQEILEVGCGSGLVCEELGQRKAIMVGIDASSGALEKARIHAQRSGLGQNIYFQQGYAEAMPYADGSFSAIVCFDTLEHVMNLQATVREIVRVLAPGGVFVFATLNRTLLARFLLIWFGVRFPHSGLTPGLHKHSHLIKPKELRSLLRENGLQVREVTGFMPRGFSDGHLKMGPGWFTGIAYAGYATKER